MSDAWNLGDGLENVCCSVLRKAYYASHQTEEKPRTIINLDVYEITALIWAMNEYIHNRRKDMIMTNADCIRRMNDEQLYDFLSEWECGDIDYSITFCDLCKQGGNELNLDCDGCRKHWLQRDAVEYGGLMYWKRNTVFDTADRKTESNSEKPNNSTISKMEQVDEPQTDCNGCKFVGTYDTEFPCANCSRKTKDYYAKDEPHTEREGE